MVGRETDTQTDSGGQREEREKKEGGGEEEDAGPRDDNVSVG